MSTSSATVTRIERGDPRYPARIVERLAAQAPETLYVRGDPGALAPPLTAIFCSVSPPPDLVLPAADLARALCTERVRMVGGFQSPVERMMLGICRAEGGAAVISPAREILRMRPTPERERALREGKVVLASRFADRRRPDAAMSVQRNRLVAALADEVVVVHATERGRIHRLVDEVADWGVRVRCLDHPANRPLLLIGAAPFAFPAAGGPAPRARSG